MELIEIVLKSLTEKRSDEEFYNFWETKNTAIVEIDVDDHILPRQLKLPMHFDESLSPHYHQTPKEMYRVIQFEAYDRVTNGNLTIQLGQFAAYLDTTGI